MLSFKHFVQKSGNDHREIEIYPEEASRQLNIFHDQIHRKQSPIDSDGDEHPQDTASRDAFHKKHGIVRIPIDDIEKRSKEVARHLDLYHQHFPDIAKHWNMSPMNSLNTHVELAVSDIKHKRNPFHSSLAGVARTGRKIYDTLRGKNHDDEENKRFTNAIKEWSVKYANFADDIKQHTVNKNHALISAWHEDNPDHHHLTGPQAYGNFKYDYQKSAPHMRVPSEQEFTDHWNKINKGR